MAKDFLKPIIESTEYRLIETLADRVAQEIFGKYSTVPRIEIEIKKPAAFENRKVGYGSVRIERTQEDYSSS